MLMGPNPAARLHWERALQCYRISTLSVPLLLPSVWDAADNGTEHEGCDKGEENQVDEAFHSIIAESCQSLDVILQRERSRVS